MVADSKNTFVKVYDTTSEVDLGIVIALLEDNGIPVYLEEKGMGEYLRIVQGVNIQGSSVMVRQADFERAKELVNQLWREQNSGEAMDEVELSKQALAAQGEDEVEPFNEYEPLEKRRRLLKNILRALVIISFVIIIILQLLAD